MAKTILLSIGWGLVAFALFIVWTPWRVHGGRFFVEYMIVGVFIILIAAAFFYAAMRVGL